ncbi:MAG TPA: hypothetical protein VHF46_01590 [Rubrobacteraceae bacterium]|nr:hypothetical protein [Rubrobacteraceae bacterium]
MLSSKLIRWGGLAAMLAGVLLVVAALLDLAVDPDEPVSVMVTRGVYAFQSAVNLLAVVLLLIGLVGLYARQSEAAGLLGLVGFLVAFLGTALATGFHWATLFIVPSVAVVAPGFVNEGPPPGFFLMFITFAVGWLLFGVATLRAHVYPRAAAILLIGGVVFSLLPLPSVDIVLAVAVAWMGYVLFMERDAAAEPTSRASQV